MQPSLRVNSLTFYQMLNARVHRRLQSGPVAGGPRQVGPSLSSSRRSVRAAAAEAAAPEVKIDVSTPSGQASLTTESGQETLRAALVAQKVDLYDMVGSGEMSHLLSIMLATQQANCCNCGTLAALHTMCAG